MEINENTVRKMVEEALQSVLNESVNMADKVGINGNLKKYSLIDPADMFKNEWDDIVRIINGGERVNLNRVFGQTLAYKIWKQYHDAMMSKEGKKALGFIQWMKYVCNGKFGHKILAYHVDDNFVFGLWSMGYFVTVYLAPNNVAGLYRLITSLCEYSNIVFPVTEDLGKMLNKLGVPKSEDMHTARWRGRDVQKNVFGTSREAIHYGIMLLNCLQMMR